MSPNFFKPKATKQSMTCEFRMQLFIFGMAAMLTPLWFGDSMQGQSLGSYRNEPLQYFHYTFRLAY